MTLLARLGCTTRWGLLAVLALLCSEPESVAAPLLRAFLHFSSEPVTSQASVEANVPEKGEIYCLSLEPDFDVRHHVISLFLVFRRSSDRTTAGNLLDTTGALHGYQRYIFAASDFARGARQSMYGERRTIVLDRLGLMFRIDVTSSAVSPLPGDKSGGLHYQFSELGLLIEVSSAGSVQK